MCKMFDFNHFYYSCGIDEQNLKFEIYNYIFILGWPGGAVTPTVYRCGAVFIFSTATVCMTPSVLLHKLTHEIIHKIN